MDKQPAFTTERLLLRQFTLVDAPPVQELAGNEAITVMPQ